jgi:tetratricopeptide (TPR) repeat protein
VTYYTKQNAQPLHPDHAGQFIERTASQFRYLTGRYALFSIVFFFLFLTELLCLLLFLPFLAKSFLLAALVAATFLTAFAYFVLRFYFQTKKPEQLLLLREEFIQNCQRLFPAGHDPVEAKKRFLQAVYQLIHRLEGQEYAYYRVPFRLEALVPLMQKFSVWCHWSHVQLMKELLHAYCIRTLLDEVKAHPTNLELHTNLARAYIALCKLYQNPSKQGAEVYSFIAKEYADQETIQKFRKTAQCAIEELKIILHYVSHDVWALSQLASVYHDLDQKEEERKTYELLLQYSPHEREARYRLGILYFQLGFMAHGLRIYEDLRRMNDPQSDELIRHYDIFHSQEAP